MALGIHLNLFDRGYDAVGAAVPVRRVIYHTMPFLFSSAVVRSNFSLWCPPRPNLSSSTSFWRDGCDVSCFCRRCLNPMELSHSACRPEIVLCMTSSTATHATTALGFTMTCTLVLERQSLKPLIRVIVLALRLDWIYYFVPVGCFLDSAHFFAPLWNVSKEVACLPWFLTTLTIANACSFSQDKIIFLPTINDQEV